MTPASPSTLSLPAVAHELGEPDLFGLAAPDRSNRPALITASTSVTYGELASRVHERSAQLGTTRRLILLEAARDIPTLVTYLAALAGRHPVLLVEPEGVARFDELVANYDPDVVQVTGSTEPREVRLGSRHDLHPDLAVLLSTSGSTGSPKLVRLSRDNVLANAHSIATYLAIHDSDRAMTSLPLHYCYGLSVLHSHLLSGAGVVLTDLSVADDCFWELFRATGATSFAGVPHTFELLDATGFADRDLPHLRYVTQAGGRLRADQVTRYAELGNRRGWELFVMYGQTEATARMAYLPPSLAAARPAAIGIPVPGGTLRMEPVEGVDADIGELVYTGPNVMLGYAHQASDLAAGPELNELRTGDLARQAPDGLWEIVGRRDRIAKVAGHRIDLDHLERRMAEQGEAARVITCEVAGDDRLWVFIDRARHLDGARRTAVTISGLPPAAVRVSLLDRMPLTSSAKVDYAALARQAVALAQVSAPEVVPEGRLTPQNVRDTYAALLGRADATVADSFVSLGGDSLSYVEASLRLARQLGDLPGDWPHRSATELAELSRPRRRWITVEPMLWLRALAILLIVASHADLITVLGGAHVLLAVAGFSLARFQLPIPGRTARMRSILATTGRIALPSALWIAAVTLTVGTYDVGTVFLLNGLVGSDTWTDQWQFWFLESLVWTLAATALLLGTPFLDRIERARPVAFALTLVLATLIWRYLWTGVEADATERYTPGVIAWCFALGWLAGVVTSRAQRWLVVLLAIVACVGFFGELQRELLVAGAIAVLVWGRPISVPRPVATALGALAGASLYIYLTHWQVYPGLEVDHPVLAVVASLFVGWATWILVSRLSGVLASFHRYFSPSGSLLGAQRQTSPESPTRTSPDS